MTQSEPSALNANKWQSSPHKTSYGSFYNHFIQSFVKDIVEEDVQGQIIIFWSATTSRKVTIVYYSQLGDTAYKHHVTAYDSPGDWLDVAFVKELEGKQHELVLDAARQWLALEKFPNI